MRITLVISSLDRGGAERVLSLLANCWAERGHQITLLTLDRGGAPAYPLHDSILHRNLGLPPGPSRHLLQGLSRSVRRVRALRRALWESKPDLVLSFLDRPNILTLLASRGLGAPLVVAERTDPAHYDLGPLWSRLRRWTYRWAAALVCQTDTVLAWFQRRIKVRGYVIANPVLPPSSALDRRQQRDGRQGRLMVAMGRLDLGKGFDLLLEAFARVAARHPQWSLEILGKGPVSGQLQEQCRRLGLTQQVRFAGEVADSVSTLDAADLFVLSSRYEGFPNALCEAMACGLPAVAFDCSPGVAAIVRHEVDGVLVPPEDVPALAAAMDRLMGDPAERERLAARAPDVVERFSLERALQAWERLFQDLAPHLRGRLEPQARPQAVGSGEKRQAMGNRR